jgi:hypothetical protein
MKFSEITSWITSGIKRICTFENFVRLLTIQATAQGLIPKASAEPIICGAGYIFSRDPGLGFGYEECQKAFQYLGEGAKMALLNGNSPYDIPPETFLPGSKVVIHTGCVNHYYNDVGPNVSVRGVLMERDKIIEQQKCISDIIVSATGDRVFGSRDDRDWSPYSGDYGYGDTSALRVDGKIEFESLSKPSDELIEDRIHVSTKRSDEIIKQIDPDAILWTYSSPARNTLPSGKKRKKGSSKESDLRTCNELIAIKKHKAPKKEL